MHTGKSSKNVYENAFVMAFLRPIGIQEHLMAVTQPPTVNNHSAIMPNKTKELKNCGNIACDQNKRKWRRKKVQHKPLHGRSVSQNMKIHFEGV